MHRQLVIVALSAALLGACGKEAAQPKTAEEVVAEAGKLAQPEPGQYETKVKMMEFSVPGLPPEQAERLKSMMGGIERNTSTYCLTPSEAKKGFEESIRKMSEGQGGLKCNFDQFDVDGGELTAEMSCKGPQGMTSTMQLDGTATAQSTSMHMKMAQKAGMVPGGEVRMEMQMDSRRVGDCPG